MRVNRFVLDANVWISYIITRSEQRLVDMVVNEKITLFICEELLLEMARVFTYPQLKPYKINVRKAIHFVKSISVEHTLVYPVKRYVEDDINDDYIVALALQTNSGFITSGDKHILSAKEKLESQFKKLQIITKAEFEKMYKK